MKPHSCINKEFSGMQTVVLKTCTLLFELYLLLRHAERSEYPAIPKLFSRHVPLTFATIRFECLVPRSFTAPLGLEMLITSSTCNQTSKFESVRRFSENSLNFSRCSGSASEKIQWCCID